MNLVERISDCIETMVSAVLKINLDLSWKKSKKIWKIFKDNSLNITTETNLQITEYLDVMFNLKTGKYHLFRKQNNSLQYIHKKSNHQPSIIKRVPSVISK